MVERYRDVILIYENTKVYVISCDSLGAIGNKKDDLLKVSEEIVGKTVVDVALSEVLSLGAYPIVISDALSTEMTPTGEKIINGIKSELNENGLDDVMITGSTEENFKTYMTGVGITVIAKASYEKLKVKKVRAGMHVGLFGYPRVGNEVLRMNDYMGLNDYINISKCDEIVEAVPVGSKGIGYELEVLKGIYGLNLAKKFSPNLDISKSGGPSTCCIVVFDDKDTSVVRSLIDKPFTYMGYLN